MGGQSPGWSRAPFPVPCVHRRPPGFRPTSTIPYVWKVPAEGRPPEIGQGPPRGPLEGPARLRPRRELVDERSAAGKRALARARKVLEGRGRARWNRLVQAVAPVRRPKRWLGRRASQSRKTGRIPRSRCPAGSRAWKAETGRRLGQRTGRPRPPFSWKSAAEPELVSGSPPPSLL